MEKNDGIDNEKDEMYAKERKRVNAKSRKMILVLLLATISGSVVVANHGEHAASLRGAIEKRKVQNSDAKTLRCRICSQSLLQSPFPCTECSKRSDLTSNLNNHINIHTNNMVDRCPKCPKEFKNRRILIKHLKLAHLYYEGSFKKIANNSGESQAAYDGDGTDGRPMTWYKACIGLGRYKVQA